MMKLICGFPISFSGMHLKNVNLTCISELILDL